MSEQETPDKPPVRLVKPVKRAGRGLVTRQLYEEMFEVYVKGARTVNALKRAVGVVHKTAKKAIEYGWPERNWDSLKSRAAFYDKLQDAAANKESPERAKEARDFMKMREEYLQIAHGVRSALAQALGVILPAMAGAATTSTRVTMEEVLDAQGNVLKRIRRTVTVQPSIFDLVSSAHQVAGALERTGGGELEQLLAKPPAGTKKRPNLTVQQWEYMASNAGRLPPGVTLADLGDA